MRHEKWGEGVTVGEVGNSNSTIKSPGQIAYEEDVRRRPTYDTGEARAGWDKLEEWTRA